MSGYAHGGIMALPGDGGDSVPAFLSGCDYVIPAYLAARLTGPVDAKPGELSPGTEDEEGGEESAHGR